MSNDFHLPPMGFGPGSQAGDDEALSYPVLPQDMRTYSPHLPEIEDPDALAPALDLLRRVAAACAAVARTGAGVRFDLAGLDAANRGFLAETLGEGEVSAKAAGVPATAVQESVFAGVWTLTAGGGATLEVAPVPTLLRSRAFVPLRPGLGTAAPSPSGLANAPALLAELSDKSARWRRGAALHVVNLTLLPHTEADLDWLELALGHGSVTLLSRGYGNCRITATALPNVWRVQFFNSMDTLILDTFEVTDMPEVALAAPEDLADSGRRLLDVLEAVT